MNATATGDLGLVKFDIFWTRLIAMLDEQATAIQRSAFSPLVREAGDCSVGMFSVDGGMIAQAVTGTPGHVFALPACIGFILDNVPVERWRPGDVVITNDPYENCGHQYDLTVASPVFRNGGLVGICASTAHVLDIGGRPASAHAKDVYEEGLIIPPVLLREEFRPNLTLEALLRANVRTPEQTLGDVSALLGVNDVVSRRFVEYMDELGIESLGPVAQEMMTRSEAALRAAIKRVPDGEYSGETRADGFEDETVSIKVTLTVRGDQLDVDFSGSSGASKYGINVVSNYSSAYAVYALKCALAPDLPNNQGSARPISVHVPEGSLLNAARPSPIGMRHIIGHLIPAAIYDALSKALPDRIPAEGSGAVWQTVVKGARTADNSGSFLCAFLSAGGMGARPDKDGLSCTAFPTGTRAIPVEVLESTAPVLFHAKELIPDSGGAGRFHGGLGQRIVLGMRAGWSGSATVVAEHTEWAPRGAHGGHCGALGAVVQGGQSLSSKATHPLDHDNPIALVLPGGGGFGDPEVAAFGAGGCDGD